MIVAVLVSVSISVVLEILSIVFKLAGKIRLTIPLLYLLTASASTLFTDWTSQHESLVLAGLYVLLALVVLSWIYSLVKTIQEKKQQRFIEEDIAWQIKKARELGIPLDRITFDEDYNLIDPRTGKPVDFRSTKDE